MISYAEEKMPLIQGASLKVVIGSRCGHITIVIAIICSQPHRIFLGTSKMKNEAEMCS